MLLADHAKCGALLPLQHCSCLIDIPLVSAGLVAMLLAMHLSLQLYVFAASATPAANPAERATLRMALLMPDTGLLATPLYTKRLCNVPLAQVLLTPGQMVGGQVSVSKWTTAAEDPPVRHARRPSCSIGPTTTGKGCWRILHLAMASCWARVRFAIGVEHVLCSSWCLGAPLTAAVCGVASTDCRLGT